MINFPVTMSFLRKHETAIFFFLAGFFVARTPEIFAKLILGADFLIKISGQGDVVLITLYILPALLVAMLAVVAYRAERHKLLQENAEDNNELHIS